MLICLELLRLGLAAQKSAPGIELVLWKQNRLHRHTPEPLCFALWRRLSEHRLSQGHLGRRTKKANSYTDLVSGVNCCGKSEIELK